MPRAIYTISDEVLHRFESLVPQPRERSRVVERLILNAIEDHERQLVEAAKRIETDSRFADVREVSIDVDSVAGEAID